MSVNFYERPMDDCNNLDPKDFQSEVNSDILSHKGRFENNHIT